MFSQTRGQSRDAHNEISWTQPSVNQKCSSRTKHRTQKSSRSQTNQIALQSKYLGIQWAGKILKDWGCSVSEGTENKEAQIVITDELNYQNIKNKNCLIIILTDINISSPHCLALSGVLSISGQKQQLFIPKFIVESAVSNGLAILCLQHLYDKNITNNENEQIRKISIIELLKYFGIFFSLAKANHFSTQPRGNNLLEGGAPFYSVYQCKQGHLAVGNLEAKFYKEMINGLNLTLEEKQFWKQNQIQMEEWPKMRSMLSDQFSQKTAKEWEQYFRSYDTCITEIKAPFKSSKIQPQLSPLRPKL